MQIKSVTCPPLSGEAYWIVSNDSLCIGASASRSAPAALLLTPVRCAITVRLPTPAMRALHATTPEFHSNSFNTITYARIALSTCYTPGFTCPTGATGGRLRARVYKPARARARLHTCRVCYATGTHVDSQLSCYPRA